MVAQNLLLLLVLAPFVSAALAATLPIGARNGECWLAGLTMVLALVVLGVLGGLAAHRRPVAISHGAA